MSEDGVRLISEGVRMSGARPLSRVSGVLSQMIWCGRGGGEGRCGRAPHHLATGLPGQVVGVGLR